MTVALITGSSGLIGGEAARYFDAKGFDVVGIDNDMRAYFFGQGASTARNRVELQRTLSRFTHIDEDVRNFEAIDKLFQKYGRDIAIVIHAAAQPSHDWAAKEPLVDFGVNANGTHNLLEATRLHCPSATFIFTSTNKVYGDLPNDLPLDELEERWEISRGHPFHEHGIDESMSIDNSLHSLFGASKVAGDVLAQEYGKYFGMNTGIFRGGCLTGPSHSGAELHGFLSYLVQCAVRGNSYRVFGYKGKQVRDNIHSTDFVSAVWHFHQNPRPGEVYNIGGGRFSNVSMLEAIGMVEELGGYALDFEILDEHRRGDHMWYVSDVRKFQGHYPGWALEYDTERILREIIEAAEQQFATDSRS